MIIYHNDIDIFFIRFQKSASTSMTTLLKNNYNTEEPYAHTHLKDLLKLKKFNKSFFFAITRNTYERVYSLYCHWMIHYHKTNQYSKIKDFQTWVKDKDFQRYDETLKSNITNGRKTTLYEGIELRKFNYFIDFKNMEEDFKNMCKILNMKKISLPHLNKSKNIPSINKNYKDEYDEEIKKIIYENYKEEIDFFAYEFNGDEVKNTGVLLNPIYCEENL